MDIYINSMKVPKVLDYSIKRVTRNTKTEYNANGDMLIDIVARKYILELSLGMLTQNELMALYAETQEPFFKVTATSPQEGEFTSWYHLAEEPAEVALSAGGVTYKALRLVMEEQ